MTVIPEKNPVVATHDGEFHPDEVVAVAVFMTVSEILGFTPDIVRTRDPKVLAEADAVIDVGLEYDPERRRFDHHQGEFPRWHIDAPDMASAGMVWNHLGHIVTGEAIRLVCESEGVKTFSRKYPELAEALNEKGNELSGRAHQRIDIVLIQEIDRCDLGLSKPQTGHLTGILKSYNPGWTDLIQVPREEISRKRDEAFSCAVEMASEVIKAEAMNIAQFFVGNIVLDHVRTDIGMHPGSAWILDPDAGSLPWAAYYRRKDFDTVVTTDGQKWYVRCVGLKKFPTGFLPHLDPKYPDGSLDRFGIPRGVNFLHRGLFFAECRNQESALALCKCVE